MCTVERRNKKSSASYESERKDAREDERQRRSVGLITLVCPPAPVGARKVIGISPVPSVAVMRGCAGSVRALDAMVQICCFVLCGSDADCCAMRLEPNDNVCQMVSEVQIGVTNALGGICSPWLRRVSTV